MIAITSGTRNRRLADASVMRREQGGTVARFEMLDSDLASLGEGPAVGDMLFELGMTYSRTRHARRSHRRA